MGGKGLKLCRMHLGVNCEQVFAGRFTPKCILEAIFNFHEKMGPVKIYAQIYLQAPAE